MCRPVLVVALLFLMGALLCSAQHWSHGWYPGGKRDTTEISGEIKVCESGECSYLRPQHRGVLRNIFLDALTRELQRRK